MRINKSFIALTSSDASVAWSNITGTPTTLSGYGITDGVPTSRTLTINGTTYDLSANRTWTIATGTVTSVALATGTTGTDVNVSGSPITSSGTITLNIPDAGDNARGLITTGTQFIAGEKIFRIKTTHQGGLSSSNTIFLNAGVFSIKETSSVSTPSSTFGFLYAKTDKKIWYKNSDGNDYDLTIGSGGTVTSVGLSSATSGVTIGSTPVTTSGTITLTIATASGSQQGLLSSTDWTTFNNKQNALTNPVTGTGTTNYIPKWTSSSALGDSGLISDSNNNLGLGVTPSAWGSNFRALQLFGPSIYSVLDNQSNSGFVTNAYWDTTDNRWEYVGTNFASNYQQYNGSHIWYNAPSGAANTAITFTQAMTLTANGRLLLGDTSDSGERLQVTGSGKFTSSVTADRLIASTITGNPAIQGTGNDPSNAQLKLINTNGNSYSLISGITSIANAGFSIRNNTSGADILTFANTTNAATISNLAGTGTRIVVADSSGVLSTQTITTTTSGTYTPTLTSVANISSSSPELSTYTRVGDIVAVQGYLTLTPTSASLTTTIGISLPIASNFNAGTDASGIFVSTSNDRFGGITPDQTNDRVEISFTSSSNGTRSFYFSFQYQIK